MTGSRPLSSLSRSDGEGDHEVVEGAARSSEVGTAPSVSSADGRRSTSPFLRNGAEAAVDADRFDAWIFDMDDTLYPPEQGLLKLVQARINAFLIDAVNLPSDEAYVLQRQFLNEYGTTLAGLMANYSVEPERFLHEVHDVPMDSVEPNPRLGEQLAALPGRKFVLTNGAREYAGRVLARLGFADLFDGVWAIEDMDLTPKPEPSTFRRFVKQFGIDPTRAIFFEDTPRNLAPARAMGMTTVLTGDGRGHPTGDWIDHHANDLPSFLDRIALREPA